MNNKVNAALCPPALLRRLQAARSSVHDSYRESAALQTYEQPRRRKTRHLDVLCVRQACTPALHGWSRLHHSVLLRYSAAESLARRGLLLWTPFKGQVQAKACGRFALLWSERATLASSGSLRARGGYSCTSRDRDRGVAVRLVLRSTVYRLYRPVPPYP